MTASRVIVLKIVSWLVVISFVVASGVFGVWTYQLFTEPVPPGSLGLWCGNTVTEPLGDILSFGSPIGFTGVVPLAILWRRGLATGWSFTSASLLIFVCTIALLVFGIWLFRDVLPGLYLSDIVWWLRPVGGWFGI